MKLKLVGLSVIIILALGSGYFLFFRKSPQKFPSFTAKEASELTTDRARIIREKGEAELKKKQILPLIYVYENLLAKYPENEDLKRKLAELYDQTGQPEKSQALLKQKAPPH